MISMGCVQSKSGETKPRAASMKLSTVLITPDINVLSAEDRRNLSEIWNILRSQGTDMDVGFLMFARLLEKHPECRQIFIDAGKIDDPTAAHFNYDPRFRGFIREVVSGLSSCIELLDDSHLLELYLREVREIHERAKGLDRIHFQAMMKCMDDSMANMMRSSLSKQQKESLKKFIPFILSSVAPVEGGSNKRMYKEEREGSLSQLFIMNERMSKTNLHAVKDE